MNSYRDSQRWRTCENCISAWDFGSSRVVNCLHIKNSHSSSHCERCSHYKPVEVSEALKKYSPQFA